MKTLIATSVLAALLTSGIAVMAQEQNEDYLGLPGDNLNLYAVMKLFQESKTLEEFERSLNEEDSRINNLDLNGDNLIDYINVFDNVNGNVHNIVMQVAVNNRERQDVAVFTVERDRKGNVWIQLTGDEALYGKNYIIEPVYGNETNGLTPNPGYAGNARTINGSQVNVISTTTVEIATWPMVTYIFDPGYVVWRSSWYWGYYPSYWHPWRPFYWHYYYGYHYNWYDHYYAYYHRSNHHYHDYWNDYYYHHHHHSDYVAVNIREGHYKSTYSHPEERKKGEALYTASHRDQNVRRTKNVSMGDQTRRTVSNTAAEKQYANTGRETSRRTERSASVSSDRRSGAASANQRSAGSRTSVQSGPSGSENRPAVKSRPSASKSRENVSRQATPERKGSKQKDTIKKEPRSKSKESDARREIKNESKRR